jgi:hypothetical protein
LPWSSSATHPPREDAQALRREDARGAPDLPATGQVSPSPERGPHPPNVAARGRIPRPARLGVQWESSSADRSGALKVLLASGSAHSDRMESQRWQRQHLDRFDGSRSWLAYSSAWPSRAAAAPARRARAPRLPPPRRRRPRLRHPPHPRRDPGRPESPRVPVPAIVTVITVVARAMGTAASKDGHPGMCRARFGRARMRWQGERALVRELIVGHDELSDPDLAAGCSQQQILVAASEFRTGRLARGPHL